MNHYKSVLFLLLPFVCLTMLSAQAGSTAKEAPSIPNNGETPSPAPTVQHHVPVIVVSGAKIEQDIVDAVEKITVVTEQDIAEMGAKNVAEVLEHIPGVTIKTHPVAQVSMQGLSGGYVKVMVNGIAVSGDVGGGFPIETLAAADISRIEIMPGASSALYGSDAMGGVINIITKQPKLGLSVSTKQEIDTLRHYYGTAAIGYRHKAFAIDAVGAFDDMPGIIERKENALGDMQDTFIFRKNRLGFGKLNADVALPIGSFKFYGGYSDHEQYFQQSTDIASRFLTKSANGGIRTELFLGDSGIMNISSQYCFFNHKYNEEYPSYENAVPKQRWTNLHELETELNYHHAFSIEHALLSGINIKWGRIMSVDFFNPEDALLLAAFSQYTWNMQGQDTLYIVPAFRIDIAPPLQESIDPEKSNAKKTVVRKDSFLWNISPKLSIRYSPLDNLALRFSYGMGFKVPTLKQKYWLFFHPAPVQFLLYGNPDLKPEKAQNVNISIDYSPIDNLHLSASSYFTYVHNKIFAMPIDNLARTVKVKKQGKEEVHDITGTRKYLNVDKSLLTGAVFSIEYSHKWFETAFSYSVSGAFNYDDVLKRYIKSAYYVPHKVNMRLTGIIPVLFTRITLSADWDAPQLIRAGFDIRAADKIKMHNTDYVTSPDRLLVHLHLSQKVWHDRIELYAGIKNLFNNIHFMRGYGGETQEEYYGMTDKLHAYFGCGISY